MTTSTDRLSRLLRGLVAFMILANSWILFRYYQTIEDLITHRDPAWNETLWWALPTQVVLVVLTISALIAILFRWKVGVIALAVISLTAIIIQLYLGVSMKLIVLPAITLIFLFSMIVQQRDAFR